MTNVAVEVGLDLCESMREIAAFCCGDDNSAPSPVEPFTTLPSGTTAKSPTGLCSGGARVYGLVEFTFISIVSTLSVFACV